ncbi:SMC5-SMC6 complex localization factor protein 1-like [Gigantopelta aegis]|uniref:SMC5-SMC6 complex localization factor protein 1-like n=1 Tax=Gigantopelta aegis TaxID=1735272 RepID=UPI001B887FF3|nr:SMC5-SMC6 complex localization factor protein 1-like [Gigantopelta aegis]
MKRLRSRVQSKKVFLLSGFPQNERKQLAKKIHELGGLYLDSEIFRTNCTHVICGKLFRSEKFLGACATGKWILTADFIEESHVKKSWVNEDTYEWSPYHDRKDCPMSLLVAPKRWRLAIGKSNELAFKGWKVAVLAGSHNRNSTFKRLLTGGGADLYGMTAPVKNPGRVASKVAYIFTEGKAAHTLHEQGLMDYGVLLLKPEFIAAFLLQISSDPMDYLAVETKKSGTNDDFSFNLSQECHINSSQDSSHSVFLTKDTSIKLTKPVNKGITAESPKTPGTPLNSKLSANSSTPCRLSQSSLEDFFKTSRRLSAPLTPCSSVKKFPQERCVDALRASPSQSTGSCSASNRTQQFHPQLRLDFEQDPILSVKPVTVNRKLNGTVISNACTPQNLKPVEKLNLDETPTHNGSWCSAKRKIEETKPENLQTKKIKKRHPEKLWKPTFVRWTHNQATNKDILPTEFPESLASLIEICVDEKNLLTALDLTSSMLTVTKYPQPRTIHAIITNILENASNCRIAQKAFGVLMSIMNMHPPTTALMQSVYLSAFQSQQDDCSAEIAWNYISHVISNAVAEVECMDVNKNYQLLLQFLTSLFEWNFSNLLLLNESSDHTRLSKGSLVSCMLVQVLWSPSFNIAPNSRTRALLDHLQECLLLNVPFVNKHHVLELLLSLVSMTAQCCHLADRGAFSDIVEGDRRMAFVFELARKLSASCIDEVQTLQVILRHLQPSWLCLRVCQILLGSFDDYLLLDKLDGQQISLAKIVTQYFFLLPRLVLQKGKPASQIDRTVEPRTSHSTRSTATQTVEGRESELKTVEVFTASSKQSKTTMKKLVNKVNKRNSKGESLFHLACIRNDTHALRQLLQIPGVDVNVQDYAGWTPLHEACNHGHLECVEMLLKFVPAKTVDSYFNNDNKCPKVDFLLSTPDGITPLHDAVNNNKVDVCRMLLKYGGIRLLKAKTEQGLYPVDLAQTIEMKNLLSATLQEMFVSNSQELASSQEQALSQDSQRSTGSHRTSYIPPDFLYEQVLNTEDGTVKVCAKDCMKYVTLVMFLLDSYIIATGLLLKYNSRTPKKNSSFAALTEDSSQESSQISQNLRQNDVENLPSSKSQSQNDAEKVVKLQNLKQKCIVKVLNSHTVKHCWVENNGSSFSKQGMIQIKREPLNPVRLKLKNSQNGVQVMCRQSHRLIIKREVRALRQMEANILPETSGKSKDETAGKLQPRDETRGDFHHLRKMKHHLKHFETHLQRITNKEDFKTLESKLACLNVSLSCI